MGEPQGFNRKEFMYRVGTFFLLVAIALLGFFLISEQAGLTNFNYFCSSIGLFVIAFIFRGQYKKPAPPPSGRFSIIGRARSALTPKPKEKKEEKKK